MRKFQIKIEGKVYEVEVEEVGGNESSTGTISVPPPVAAKVKEEAESQKVVKPSSDSVPAKAPTKATTEPTERSMFPPVRIQSNIPVARITT